MGRSHDHQRLWRSSDLLEEEEPGSVSKSLRRSGELFSVNDRLPGNQPSFASIGCKCESKWPLCIQMSSVIGHGAAFILWSSSAGLSSHQPSLLRVSEPTRIFSHP